MEDVTEKYKNMIEAFECDFAVLDIEKKCRNEKIIKLDLPISEKLINDIELLKELSFNLRHQKAKIIENQ